MLCFIKSATLLFQSIVKEDYEMFVHEEEEEKWSWRTKRQKLKTEQAKKSSECFRAFFKIKPSTKSSIPLKVCYNPKVHQI